ncbi:hypothetical protein [Paraburkholderia sp. J8-2]|uniref:hypothetical protein n=1 Tax=Paraburkholderia sp. J8-2 TaxID=2805440 RepID=UPI002AB5F49D|nr:hypothetical protein [Paraburkholderia sp. J8-2]
MTKRDIANDLFRIITNCDLAYATKLAVLEHVLAVWPEWSGKFDRFVRANHAVERELDMRRVSRTEYYQYSKVPDGVRYWSKSALAAWADGARESSKRFRFEHVVPRSVIRSYVLGPSPYKRGSSESWQGPLKSISDTRAFLETVCLGAIILRTEDKDLEPIEFSEDISRWGDMDVWVRYREANARRNACITVFDLATGERVVAPTPAAIPRYGAYSATVDAES